MKRLSGLLFVWLACWACSPDNAEIDDQLSEYFKQKGVTGTFGMFNNGSGRFTIYNMPRFRDSAYLPASTFKIINALAAIETGRIRDSAVVIPWDGKTREIAEWNRDLTLKEAFTVSAVPVFQEIARRIGRDSLQHFIDTLGYGSLRGRFEISPASLDTFWLDNSLKVTADEQLGLVKRLYFGQLPFQARSQRMVRNMMIRETSRDFELAYKTGLGVTESGHRLGWVVGWVELEKHPYFFVLQVETDNPDINLVEVRIELLRDILRHYRLLEGKEE